MKMEISKHLLDIKGLTLEDGVAGAEEVQRFIEAEVAATQETFVSFANGVAPCVCVRMQLTKCAHETSMAVPKPCFRWTDPVLHSRSWCTSPFSFQI